MQDDYAQAQAIEAVSKPDKARQYLEREQEDDMAEGGESAGDSADKASDSERQPEADKDDGTGSDDKSCSEHSSKDEQGSAAEEEEEEEECEGSSDHEEDEEECSPSQSKPRETGTGSNQLPAVNQPSKQTASQCAWGYPFSRVPSLTKKGQLHPAPHHNTADTPPGAA